MHLSVLVYPFKSQVLIHVVYLLLAHYEAAFCHAVFVSHN